MKIAEILLCMGVCLGAGGCSMETSAISDVDEEPAGEVSEAMFQTDCGLMQPDVTIHALNAPQWSNTGMPVRRLGCTGSRIVDVYNYQEGEDVGVNGVHIGLADNFNGIDKTECERLWLGTSLYKNVSIGWTHVKDTSSYGSFEWKCPSSGPCVPSCTVPSVNYYSSVSDDHTYRFVIGASRNPLKNGRPDFSDQLKEVTINARRTD